MTLCESRKNWLLTASILISDNALTRSDLNRSAHDRYRAKTHMFFFFIQGNNHLKEFSFSGDLSYRHLQMTVLVSAVQEMASVDFITVDFWKISRNLQKKMGVFVPLTTLMIS